MKIVIDRGVSTVIGYAMLLGVVALVSTGLVLSMGGFVDSQQQSTTQATLLVVGNGAVADIESADRLVQTVDDPEAVVVSMDLPSTPGEEYEITLEYVDAEDRYLLTLTAVSSSDSVSIPVDTRTPLEPTTVDGDTVQISYDPTANTLQLEAQ